MDLVGKGDGRRLVTAVLVVPRALRADLWTATANPLPRMVKPRWLGLLPHALVLMFAASTFFFPQGQNRLAEVLAVVLAGALVMAMFQPVAAWWTATLTMVVGTLAVGDPFPWHYSVTVAPAGVLFLLALRVRPRAVVEAVVITVLAGLLCTGFDLDGWNGGVFQLILHTGAGRTVLLFTVAAVFGAALRARRVARGRLVMQEEVTAEERARRTLLEERSRIARELHDVVAHHLSVISIQAQVAPHLVDDPPTALTENLTGIRQNALEALTELRRVLGVLRVSDGNSEATRHTPQPTLDRLDELVGNVRAAGVSVATEITGEPRTLSPGVELSAFRLVQEALSNAMRHAPGASVRVVVAYRPASLTIRVSNTAPARPAPPSPGAGHGLLGMRERTAMLGGELAAGPTPDGGYEVLATLPTTPLNRPVGTVERSEEKR